MEMPGTSAATAATLSIPSDSNLSPVTAVTLKGIDCTVELRFSAVITTSANSGVPVRRWLNRGLGHGLRCRLLCPTRGGQGRQADQPADK